MATPSDPTTHAPDPTPGPKPSPSPHPLDQVPQRTWAPSGTGSIIFFIFLVIGGLFASSYYFRFWPFGLQQPHDRGRESLVIEEDALATAEQSLGPVDVERRRREAGATSPAGVPRADEPTTAPVVQDTVGREELELLASRIDALAARIDSLPATDTETATGLDRELLRELERLPSRVQTQGRRIEDLARRLARVERALESPRTDGATVGPRAGIAEAADEPEDTTAEGPGATPIDRSEPAAIAAGAEDAGVDVSTDPELDRAIALFREGRYREAREAFDRLREERPENAIVYYYSALTTGLVSGDWQETADRFARQGIEYERVGRPAPARVDEALEGLTTETGKDWINAYRRRLLPASGQDNGEVDLGEQSDQGAGDSRAQAGTDDEG